LTGVNTTKILSILEAAQIEPPKARAIAESLELAFREQEDDLTKRLMTKQDGADIKAEIIKWMFLFWVGQIAVLVAAAKFLFNA
jgi:DNA-binding transcriptional MerR regulator